MRRCVLALLAGCGRIGFESAGGELGTDAPGDGRVNDGVTDDAVDAMIDAPPGSMTFTFGEAPVTMFKTVTRDTYVSNEAGETLFNYGGDDEIRIEADVGERALIGFTLTALPPTATIVSATITITITQIPLAPQPIELHRVLEPWNEGVQSGAGGAANYTIREGTLPWLTPGAGTPLSSSATFGTFTPVLGGKSVVVPPAVIQAWVAAPDMNHGIVMISTSNESTRWRTSEADPPSARPVLTVTFTP